MKTAEEFLNSYNAHKHAESEGCGCRDRDIVAMKEFAEYHVKLALEEAANNVQLIKECGKTSESDCNAVFCRNCIDIVDKDSILNCYKNKI